MMKTLVACALALAFFVSSCTKWQDPATSITSTDRSVSILLLNPSAHAMQEVRVRGKVWEIVPATEEGGPLTFKLADSDGNYIKVIWSGEATFEEENIVVAEGLFDNNFIASENRFDSTLTAEKISVVKPR